MKPKLSTLFKASLVIFLAGLLFDAALTFFLGDPLRESNMGIAYTMQTYGMLVAVLIPTGLQLTIFLPLAYASLKVGVKHDLTARLGLSLVTFWGAMHILAGSTWIWGPH